MASARLLLYVLALATCAVAAIREQPKEMLDGPLSTALPVQEEAQGESAKKDEHRPKNIEHNGVSVERHRWADHTKDHQPCANNPCPAEHTCQEVANPVLQFPIAVCVAPEDGKTAVNVECRVERLAFTDCRSKNEWQAKAVQTCATNGETMTTLKTIQDCFNGNEMYRFASFKCCKPKSEHGQSSPPQPKPHDVDDAPKPKPAAPASPSDKKPSQPAEKKPTEQKLPPSQQQQQPPKQKQMPPKKEPAKKAPQSGEEKPKVPPKPESKPKDTPEKKKPQPEQPNKTTPKPEETKKHKPAPVKKETPSQPHQPAQPSAPVPKKKPAPVEKAVSDTKPGVDKAESTPNDKNSDMESSHWAGVGLAATILMSVIAAVIVVVRLRKRQLYPYKRQGHLRLIEQDDDDENDKLAFDDTELSFFVNQAAADQQKEEAQAFVEEEANRLPEHLDQWDMEALNVPKTFSNKGATENESG